MSLYGVKRLKHMGGGVGGRILSNISCFSKKDMLQMDYHITILAVEQTSL